MFQQLKKILNKTRQKIKKFNLFQEEANKTKNFQKNNKKFVKDFTASGFGVLTK